jgi:hypothetical protein
MNLKTKTFDTSLAKCWGFSLGKKMKYYDKLVFDGEFKEVEKLIEKGVIRLGDLSEEAFGLFKTWIEG